MRIETRSTDREQGRPRPINGRTPSPTQQHESIASRERARLVPWWEEKRQSTCSRRRGTGRACPVFDADAEADDVSHELLPVASLKARRFLLMLVGFTVCL